MQNDQKTAVVLCSRSGIYDRDVALVGNSVSEGGQNHRVDSKQLELCALGELQTQISRWTDAIL